MNEALAPFVGPALWLGGILGISTVIVLIVRRMWWGSDSKGGEATGMFSLDDLRRMRDCGDLTIAEFDNLKQKLIDEMRGPGSEK